MIQIHCAHTRIADVSELKPHPANPNRHPASQIELLAKIIQGNGWRAPVVISKRSGFVTKGHGRIEAAKLAGIQQIPVDEQAYDSEAEEIADLIADNKIAELAELDEKAVAELLEQLDTGEIDMEITGFTEEEIAGILGKEEKEPLPQVPFSEFLMEANNYVVLKFTNEADWLAAMTHFNLQTVTATMRSGKPWYRGIGRVLDGAAYLTRVTGENALK
jgi:hypothetical protein